MHWSNTFLLIVSAVCVLGAAGCSSDTTHGTVSGTVTLDGSPLASGLIRFIPADGQTATADAAIANGEYTATVPIGEKRVSISAPKVTGQRKLYDTPDSPTMDIVEELLPERYNARTELSIRVEPGAQNADFPLGTAK